jgi:hypothetical protein
MKMKEQLGGNFAVILWIKIIAFAKYAFLPM